MEGKNAKTLLSVLEILKQETDINHTMTQRQIRERLESRDADEPVVCDRRAVRRAITALQDLGFPVYALVALAGKAAVELYYSDEKTSGCERQDHPEDTYGLFAPVVSVLSDKAV